MGTFDTGKGPVTTLLRKRRKGCYRRGPSLPGIKDPQITEERSSITGSQRRKTKNLGGGGGVFFGDRGKEREKFPNQKGKQIKRRIPKVKGRDWEKKGPER